MSNVNLKADLEGRIAELRKVKAGVLKLMEHPWNLLQSGRYPGGDIPDPEDIKNAATVITAMGQVSAFCFYTEQNLREMALKNAIILDPIPYNG